MRQTIRAALAIILSVLYCGVSFCSISITQLKVVDELGSARSNFSNAEKIGFEVAVYNSVQTSERLKFTFAVKDPSGRTVLTQAGNSAPGNAGNIGSSIRNIPISKIFSTSGNYSVAATAVLGGESAVKTEYFRVTAPIITLSYPPNGAENISDKPLVFRWVATGAARYKIYVGVDRSFFTPIHTGETSSLSYAYPMNPSSSIENLSGGKLYYWKVEGLDAAGQVIAKTNQPYSFTLSQGAAGSSTVDVGITDIDFSKTAAFPGHLPIDVVIQNKGSRAVSPFNLSLNVNGLGIDPPKRVEFLNPGQKLVTTFQYKILNYNEPLVCVAVIDIFDDDPKNNRFVKRLVLGNDTITAKAKILGAVQTKGQASKKIEKAQVFYSGAKRGFSVTGKDGMYKIDDLPLGDYTVWAKSAGYKESERKTVQLQKEVSYTGIDFELEVSTAVYSQPAGEQFNLAEAWEKLKKKLDASTVAELEGFTPYFVNNRELMKSVIEGKAGISREQVK